MASQFLVCLINNLWGSKLSTLSNESIEIYKAQKSSFSCTGLPSKQIFYLRPTRVFGTNSRINIWINSFIHPCLPWHTPHDSMFNTNEEIFFVFSSFMGLYNYFEKLIIFKTSELSKPWEIVCFGMGLTWFYPWPQKAHLELNMIVIAPS